MLQPQDKPLYILPQLKKRFLIPKVFALMLLGIIFYLGILINLILLDLTNETVELIKLIATIVILFLVGVGIISSISRSKKKYIFYRNRIMFNRKQVLYGQINNTNQKQNINDKLFKTYSIKLNNKFTLKNIPKSINISDYIKSMISYASQNQY